MYKLQLINEEWFKYLLHTMKPVDTFTVVTDAEYCIKLRFSRGKPSLTKVEIIVEYIYDDGINEYLIDFDVLRISPLLYNLAHIESWAVSNVKTWSLAFDGSSWFGYESQLTNKVKCNSRYYVAKQQSIIEAIRQYYLY